MNAFRFAVTPKIRGVISSILVGSIFLSTNCVAQENSMPSKTVSLEEFLGYYQLPNKVAFIEFELKDKVFFAKQLWDNKAYQLIQIRNLFSE